MVEGPKVVIKCQRLQCLRGQTLLLVAVQGKNSSLDAFQSMLHTKVSDVFSIGKELFLAFVNSPLVIRLHFGMSGSERISLTCSPLPATKPDPKSRKKLSFVLTLCKNTVSFLDCTIALKPLFYAEIARSRIRRDIMCPEFDFRESITLCKQDSRPVLETIMDQTLLPGVGNVIKCEGLHLARIHPDALSNSIPSARWKLLLTFLKDFSWDWYDCTLQGREVKKHVYGRVNCASCSNTTTLIRSGSSERITYYCAHCQPLALSQSEEVPPPIGSLLSWVKHGTLDMEGGRPPWRCKACTFLNAFTASSCAICQSLHVSLEKRAPLTSCPNSSSSSSSPPASLLLRSDQFLCKCTRKASLHRVRKDGANKNRLFYACSSSSASKKCSFFSWADGDFPLCNHCEPSTLRRVLKPGENNGRYFFCCRLNENKGCGFFEFAADLRMRAHVQGSAVTTGSRLGKRKVADEETGALGAKRKVPLIIDPDVKIPL